MGNKEILYAYQAGDRRGIWPFGKAPYVVMRKEKDGSSSEILLGDFRNPRGAIKTARKELKKLKNG